LTLSKFICLLIFALAAFSGRAFVYYPVAGNPLRWNVDSGTAHPNIVNPSTKAVRYFIASDAYSAANRNAEIAAVKACFDQWQSVAGSRLRFEFAGLIPPQGLDVREDNTNVVYWAKNSLSVNGGQMNISGLRAWTSVNFAADGSILEADIVLNGSQFQWFTDFNNNSNQALFVESVLLHEIGHLVGLDHTVAGGATVISGANGISTEAGLSADEIAALRFLYPASLASASGIQGTVRLNGNPILGAAVVAEDAFGNIANATVTRGDGLYQLLGLAAGDYQIRVSPLDPSTSGTDKLMQGRDVAPEYAGAVTAFSATTNRAVTVGPSAISFGNDFNLSAGPPFRITSISFPTTVPNLVSVTRTAVSLRQGQADYYVAVSGPNIPPGAELSITGDGLEMGPSTVLEGRVVPGLNSVVAKVSVSSSAKPGLRSFVVRHGGNVAYANGYLEIAPAVPDYNFDGLNDYFQRSYWIPWTVTDASPVADPDQDGFSNDFEYRTGTNPTSATSHRLAITSASREGNSITIKWASDAGKRYQLHGRTSLDSGSWEPVGRAFTASGSEMTQTTPASDPTRFYRLELLP
jgi:hypothetical protein